MDTPKLLFYKLIISVLRVYSSVYHKLRNFFLIYFSWLYKPLSSKKNKIIALLLIALIVTIIMVYVISKKPIPPNELVFFDETKGEELQGQVYIDGTLVGDTSGTIQEIPSIYCEGSHEIMLKSDQHTLKWESKPSDCELNRVIYTVNLPEEVVSESVTLKFMIKESKELLSGNITFDEVMQGYVEGHIEIPIIKCQNITSIKMYTSDNTTDGENFIEWAHDPSWCTKHDPIIYSVSESEVR